MNVSRMALNLVVPSVAECLPFYASIGFTPVATVPDEPPHDFALLVNGSAQIMLQTEASIRTDLAFMAEEESSCRFVVYLDVDDVEALHAELAARVEVVEPLRSTDYGMREFYVRGPFGHPIGFASHEACGGQP